MGAAYCSSTFGIPTMESLFHWLFASSINKKCYHDFCSMSNLNQGLLGDAFMILLCNQLKMSFFTHR